MGQQEKVYEEVTDAKEMITALCKQYPDILWAIRPQIVTVLGIANKSRPEKREILATCRPITGVYKSLMMLNNIHTRYVIEVYWSDWNDWSMPKKYALLFHELLHVDYEIGKTIKYDVEDFRLMVDKLGVDWFDDPDLPNLINEKVEFDLSKRPNIPPDGDLKVDTGDEIVDTKDETASLEVN